MPVLKVKNKSKNKYNTESYLAEAEKTFTKRKIKRRADEALEEFKKASPKDIADGWSYEIISDKNKVSLIFNNSSTPDGLENVNLAILIDVGHCTASGKWVEGEHYLDEATENAYNKIMYDTWEALKKAYEQ